jgi:hypothetical protein
MIIRTESLAPNEIIQNHLLRDLFERNLPLYASVREYRDKVYLCLCYESYENIADVITMIRDNMVVELSLKTGRIYEIITDDGDWNTLDEFLKHVDSDSMDFRIGNIFRLNLQLLKRALEIYKNLEAEKSMV